MSTLIGTFHIFPKKQVVLNTRTPEAENVDLSFTFSSHMARNPDMQTPVCRKPTARRQFAWPLVCGLLSRAFHVLT